MKMPSYCCDMHSEPAALNQEAPEKAGRIQENFEGLGV